MNKQKSIPSSKKVNHKPSKSQLDKDLGKMSRDSNDYPLLSTKDPRTQKIFRTQDNREVLLTEPSELYDLKKSKSRNNLDRVHFSRTLAKPEKSISILKDQDDIIKLQNSIIDNLRIEISQFKRSKTEKSKNSESSQNIEQFLEEYENQIENLKKIIKRKEEVIKELKVEMDICGQQKDMRIEKAELATEKAKGELRERDRIKEQLEVSLGKEVKLKEKAEKEASEVKEKLKVVNEENKILIQNYEEVKKRFFEVDKQLHSVRVFISRISNSKNECLNILGFIEQLFNQNRNLSEKVKILNEKTAGIEKENQELKQTTEKYKKIVEELNSKLEDSDCSEMLIQKLQKKSEKILKLKQKLVKYQLKDQKTCLENYKMSEISSSDSQISAIQEELSYLKTENRVLHSKENDLVHKLKSSEKARYYYQEQTMSLKEKVNSLENQLKMIEFSVKELKSQSDSPVKQYHNVHK